LLSKSVNLSKDETSSNYFLPPQISNSSLLYSFVVVLVVVISLSLSLSLFLKHIFVQYRLTLTKTNEEQQPTSHLLCRI